MRDNHPGQSLLFFDISDLLDFIGYSDQFSGIQRVVANIIQQVMATDFRSHCYCFFVCSSAADVRAVRFDQIPPDTFCSPENIRKYFGTISTTSPIYALRAHRPRSLSHYAHRLLLDICLLLNYSPIFEGLGSTMSQYRRERRALTSTRKEDIVETYGMVARYQSIDRVARPGDKVIALDSSWRGRQTEVFQKLKNSGLFVYTLVHDLIPIVMPNVTANGVPQIFQKWLSDTLSYTSFYMAVSKASAEDLRKFLADSGKDQFVKVIQLTQSPIRLKEENEKCPKNIPLYTNEIYDVFHEQVNIKAEIRSLSFAPFVLCVGTMEPRKNNWRIATAWKHLLDQGYVDLPRLIFAGRSGWLSDQFQDLLKATNNVYGYVSIVEAPSDLELNFLYDNCLFTMMPSLYEGWGLPVGEALAHGKTCIVSNVSSLPEVGGQLVAYCDPHSVRSIAEAVLSLWQDSARREKLEAEIRKTRLRNWSDVADDLMMYVAETSDATQHPLHSARSKEVKGN